jgi:hypothetical protein
MHFAESNHSTNPIYMFWLDINVCWMSGCILPSRIALPTQLTCFGFIELIPQCPEELCRVELLYIPDLHVLG